MSNWIPCTLIISAAIVDAANRIASIIDPDIGGHQTFSIGFSSTGMVPVTHYGTQSMVAPQYVQLLQLGDPLYVKGALDSLAVEYGRDLSLQDDCNVFTADVVVRPNEDLISAANGLGLFKC